MWGNDYIPLGCLLIGIGRLCLILSIHIMFMCPSEQCTSPNFTLLSVVYNIELIM